MSENKETALEKVGPGALTAPKELLDKYSKDSRGTDHLTREDVKIPRLALAQKMSPQLAKKDSKYIEELDEGDLFNDLDGTIYGTGPIEFTVVRADKPRGVEFRSIEDGGGVLDFDVPINDPRMKFGPNGEKPIATLFYDYVLMLLPTRELIALSLKGTALKVARQLNGLMKMRGMPSFTGLYKLSTDTEKGKKGEYAVFKVANAGWVDAEMAEYAEAVYEEIRDRNLEIPREDENASGEVINAESKPVEEDIPF